MGLKVFVLSASEKHVMCTFALAPFSDCLMPIHVKSNLPFLAKWSAGFFFA